MPDSDDLNRMGAQVKTHIRNRSVYPGWKLLNKATVGQDDVDTSTSQMSGNSREMCVSGLQVAFTLRLQRYNRNQKDKWTELGCE